MEGREGRGRGGEGRGRGMGEEKRLALAPCEMPAALQCPHRTC